MAARRQALARPGDDTIALSPPLCRGALEHSHLGVSGIRGLDRGHVPALCPALCRAPGHGRDLALSRDRGHGLRGCHGLGKNPRCGGQKVSSRPCLTYDSSSPSRQWPCGGLLHTHRVQDYGCGEMVVRDRCDEICLLVPCLDTYHDQEIDPGAFGDPCLPPRDLVLDEELSQTPRGENLPK